MVKASQTKTWITAEAREASTLEHTLVLLSGLHLQAAESQGSSHPSSHTFSEAPQTLYPRANRLDLAKLGNAKTEGEGQILV